MKLSVNWLREYVTFDRPIEQMARDLTMAGLEVEESESWTPQDFARAGGAGVAADTIWNVKVTPNRGDWLSIIGVARECAALAGVRAKMPAPRLPTTPPSREVEIRIDDPDLCRRYVGLVIRGASIKESPDWLKDRLVAGGLRPIDNVVDATNYVMLELGQPLHAFDLSLLRGAQIIVRRARPGERITSIDGEDRELEPDMLVIADAERPVAIAGVMGGIDSEISDRTQDILIESANFNSGSIRRTAKRLNMVTESSFRFEREVDPSITLTAAYRAAELIQDLAGGEVVGEALDVHPRPAEPACVRLRPDRANAILGTSINVQEMARFLEAYEIGVEDVAGTLVCTVPTFRPDLTKEIDLIEEIGRGYGYDNLPMSLPARSLQGSDSPEGKLREKLRRVLMACGAQEVLTHSLADSKLAKLADKSEDRVVITNPLSEDVDSMRVMLIPNLLQTLQKNQAAGMESLSVFEIGKVYFRDHSTGSGCSAARFGEKMSVAGAMVGRLWRSGWSLPQEALAADFFLCKGVVETLLAELGIRQAEFGKIIHPLLHPTRGASIVVGGSEIGMLGEVSPSVCDALNVRGRPCAFEIDFASLAERVTERRIYAEISRYPAVERHFSIAVSRDVAYETLEHIVKERGGKLVERVALLDLYSGKQVGEGRQSVTLSVVFRSPEKTLTDDEVNPAIEEIREALAREVGAVFR